MIKMTIEVTPEIAVKVAEILGGAGPVPQQAPVPQQLPPTYSAPQTAPVQQPVAPPVQVPVQTPPVQQQAPVQTPPTYNIAQLQQACAPLIDAGKQPDIVNLINSFGVQALTQIPPERLGEFATALRGLGAQI